MSQHLRIEPARGPRRWMRRHRRVALLLVPALLVAAAGTTALVVPALGESCPGGRPLLRVAAAPELAAVVGQVARVVDEQDSCRRTEVAARPPGEVLDDLTGGRREWDVWVPDSSVWVHRADDAGVSLASVAGPVATSPVVLGLPAASAARLGEGADFADVLRSGGTPRPVPMAWPDPRRSSLALAALLGLHAAAEGAGAARGDLAGLLTAATTGLEPGTAALLGRGDLALPVGEQAVWAFNATSGEPLVAAYSGAPGSTLDYPFVVLGGGGRTSIAAAELLTGLQAPAGRRLLLSSGFRDPSGVAGPALRHVAGIDPDAVGAVRAPTVRELDRAQSLLETLRRPSRLLTVVDVSGSMGAPVPGRPRVSRLVFAMKAAGAGLRLLPPGSEAGLWEFSTDLGRRADHREVVPVAEIAGRHRAELARGLERLRAIPNGSTGLYDTTLAAVRRVREGHDPRKTNAVVLLTDGANQDPRGLDLATLLDRLRNEDDPNRPVPVIAVAYGPTSDAAALRAISDATGGVTYVAEDPRKVGTVLRDAIGQRICRPDCPVTP